MPTPSNSSIIRSFDKFVDNVDSKGVSLIDPKEQDAWASSARSSWVQNNYFDYYFSGQDIDVRLTGDTLPHQIGQLPIMELAVQVEQEKLPVYGFWSYVYDHMLRGVRVVSGALTIATTYPGYMSDLVSKAALINQTATKASNRSYPYFKDLTEDDENILKYWGSNLDPSYDTLNRNLFSVHPPFSLTVTYGVQDISIDTSKMMPDVSEFLTAYYNDSDNVLMTDENQRLVPSSPNGDNRFFIDSIELKSCQRSFTSDGSICVETYTFVARDIITTNRIV